MNYQMDVPCPVCNFMDVELITDNKGCKFFCTHCFSNWKYENYDVLDTMFEHLFDRAQEENEDVQD